MEREMARHCKMRQDRAKSGPKFTSQRFAACEQTLLTTVCRLRQGRLGFASDELNFLWNVALPVPRGVGTAKRRDGLAAVADSSTNTWAMPPT